jgi:hypothetical protein
MPHLQYGQPHKSNFTQLAEKSSYKCDLRSRFLEKPNRRCGPSSREDAIVFDENLIYSKHASMSGMLTHVMMETLAHIVMQHSSVLEDPAHSTNAFAIVAIYINRDRPQFNGNDQPAKRVAGARAITFA